MELHTKQLSYEQCRSSPTMGPSPKCRNTQLRTVVI